MNINYVQNFSKSQNIKHSNQVIKPEVKKVEAEEQQTPQKQMVNAQMALAYKVPIAFKGSVQEFQEMSDEEFSEFKEYLSEGLDTPEINEYILQNLSVEKSELCKNKNLRMAVANFLFEGYSLLNNNKKVLTKEQLNDDIFQKQTVLIVSSFDNEQLSLINNILSKKEFSNDIKVLSVLLFSVMSAKTPEEKDRLNKHSNTLQKMLNNKDLNINNKVITSIFAPSMFNTDIGNKFIDTVLSDEKLFTNNNILNNIGKISGNIKTYEQLDIINNVISKEKYNKNKVLMENIGNMIGALVETDSDYLNENRLDIFNEILNNKELYEKEHVIRNTADIISYVINSYQKEIILKILNDKKLSENFLDLAGELVRSTYNQKDVDIRNNLLDNTDYETAKRIKMHYKNVIETPYLYVNGEQDEIDVKHFFVKNYDSFVLLTKVFNDKTINTLLRCRFNNVQEYLDTISGFGDNNMEMLAKFAQSKKQDGSELTEKEKIDFINLIAAYQNRFLDTSKMQEMAENGVVDLKKLNRDLFSKLLNNSGLSNEELEGIPDEKLLNWNMTYIHLLAETMSHNRTTFCDLLKATNLYNFDDYIRDTSNIYGQTNARTKEAFRRMDYEKWLKPSVDNNVQFIAKDSNAQRLSQISTQIKEDIETLMETPAKGFIKKQFPNYVKDDKFVIPSEIENSKAQLQEFTQNILKQLAPVFKRTKNNPKNIETAQKVLTIQDNLTKRVKDIENTGEITSSKTLDLTIKMWDRNPQRDLFQGNYSTCCIGMGKGCGKFMPHYLMNTAYNMIEIKDNITDETIGNSLCYFVKDEQGKPAFIIDNIEINNSIKLSDEVGKNLRNAISQYAANVAKEVTGNDDTPIYMSEKYNDVPIDDLKQMEETLTFLGEIDCNNIYMDLYGGWIGKQGDPRQIPTKKLNLLKLK